MKLHCDMADRNFTVLTTLHVIKCVASFTSVVSLHLILLIICSECSVNTCFVVRLLYM